MRAFGTKQALRTRFFGSCGRTGLAAILLLAGCETMPPNPIGTTNPPAGSPGPSNPGDRPLPTLVVDANVPPSTEAIPPHDDGSPRPLAVATDKSNIPVEFVENELIVQTDDLAALDRLIQRHNGVLLATHDPLKFGLTGQQVHLVRIQTTAAERDRLQANLLALQPNTASQLRVGSENGANLIAAAASEAAGGMTIGINFVHRATSARDRNINEAATGNALMGRGNGQTEAYSPNPFNWSYMKVGGTQNIGVAEAWSVLDRAGKLGNKVKICVIDGGFADGTEYPPVREHNNATINALDPTEANQVPCTGGSSCPWHGINVVEACMGRLDNGQGAAGPAGPIATALTIRRSGDIFNNITAISIGLFSGANIINMSFGARIPATLSWAVIPFSEATGRARAAGKLLFAAAGNDNENIDAEDCFVACWEEAWHTPAENDGVIAVGALNLNSRMPRPDSNWGPEELDIWGPGFAWVGPDPATQRVHSFGATSCASPFVAGVAALIWAANPGLNADQVEQILMDTCNRGTGADAQRWPNALAAVVRALGNTPPDLRNVKVERQGFTGKTLSCTCEASDAEDGTPNITWRSDRSGVFGTGTQVAADLPYGKHVITCSAMDSKGSEVIETRTFELVNAAPRLMIQEPLNDASYFAGQLAYFEGWSYDIESGAKLPDASLRWNSSLQGLLGTGSFVSQTLSTVGTHTITLTGTDRDGTVSSSSINVTVAPPPPDGLPPTAFITRFEYDPFGVQPIEPETGKAYVFLDMSGMGHDAEDGYLGLDKLTWTLDTPGLSWNLPNPVHGYNAAVRLYGVPSNGGFTVTLTVTDKSGKTGRFTRTGTMNGLR